MRLEVTLVDPLQEQRTDVVIDAEDSTPVADVIAQLTQVGQGGGSSEVISLSAHRQQQRHGTIYLHGEPLDPAAPFAESGIKEGALLSLGDPSASVLAEPEGQVEVRVVGGLGAGAVHRLTRGDATIGSDPGCVVVLEDAALPPVCAIATVHSDGSVALRPQPGLGEGAMLDRDPLKAEEDTAWPVGALLTLGRVRLELETATEPDAAVEDSVDPGWVDYNRPPRLLPPERKTRFTLPAEPQEQQDRGIPWMMMGLPLVMAVTLAAILQQPRYLLMGLFSPLMMVGSYLQSRKGGKMTFRQRMAEFKDRTRRIEADAAQAVVDERLARRSEAPDPALALLIASGPRARLWERRVDDPDYLSLRLGMGDLVSQVVVTDPAELDHRKDVQRTAYDVPVTVPLRERGVVGFAGPDGLPRRLATWAVAQLCVLQSPRDTQVYVLTDAEGAPDWDWLRWVPHASPTMGQDTVVTLGIDAETNARRVAELSQILAQRESDLEGGEGRQVVPTPHIVVVFDGARRLRTLPGVVSLLKQGPRVGIFSICLDADERLLPEEADAVVVPAGDDAVTLRQQRITVVERIVPDLVRGPWFYRVARALAPVRDISGGDSDSVLPSACRLTEVMDLEPLSAEMVKARWAVQPRSSEAIIGISLDGPFALDLVRDGPHGLVAGTTGAGKSELLQSIVASLAVANQPDGMTFVLVDYKGGAAFKDCVDLPHTVGMVTDLDTHLVERALISLGAELHRREHILSDAGAKDIEDYIDIRAKRSGLPDMPRLLIVIDEFASLARELPDFVTGLVNVAQRGRSLGIHLILATQRPGGVVSPEIRANTNLRIALRVTDTSESQDVINSPEAGLIAKQHPGRAYVRLGASSLVPFQSGRVGGRRPGAVATSASLPWLASLELPKLPQPIPTRPRAEANDDAEITDLKVLVEAVCKATADLGLPPQHSPWLPALGSDVVLDELVAQTEVPTLPELPRIPYGLEDLPAQQDRRPAAIDFTSFTHLSIMGARSGRSQALRTIAASIARLTSPADVHLYGLDCGNGALLPLVDLPHCGAVVQRTQGDRAKRLFDKLSEEIVRRQEVLASGGYADIGEQRRSVSDPEERLPRIVLLLDRWEGFLGGLAEAHNGQPMEQVQTMLREGASVGLHLVLTGDRQLVNLRMGSLVEDKIGLRVPDKNDYALIGLSPRKMPDTIPDGRGFRSESMIEMQFSLIGPDASGQAQAADIRRIGAEARTKHADVPRELRPFRVDVLPARVSFDEVWEQVPHEPRPLWAMVGIGGDELSALGMDLALVNTAVIAGAPRSGRSTALCVAAESLLRGGTELVVLAPRQSPLRDLAGRTGVRTVITDVEVTEEMLEPHLEPGPVCVIIDDGELLKDMPGKEALRRLIRLGADRGQALILGGNSAEVGSGFTGWQVDAKGQQGVLIAPQSSTEGDLVGVRLARSQVGPAGPAGRALAHLADGRLITVQVPLVG